MWCVSLVFSILELISNFGSLDGRCVLYIKSDAAGMPVRVSKTGRCGRCVVYTHPPGPQQASSPAVSVINTLSLPLGQAD